MSHAVKILSALVALGAAAYIYKAHLEPEKRSPGPQAPARSSAAELSRLPAKLRVRLASADEIAAGPILRDALLRHRGREGESAIRRFRTLRGAEATARLQKEVEPLLEQARYLSAVALAERYRDAWRNSAAEREIVALLDEIREQQSALLLRMKEEANALFVEAEFERARLALKTDRELEEAYRERLVALAADLDRRIEARSSTHQPGRIPTPVAPEPEPEPVVQKPPPEEKPPEPKVDPEAKRREHARKLVTSARDLFSSRRHDPALKRIDEILEGYRDLDYVKYRREGLQAMRTLIEYKKRGAGALFNAAKVSKRGRRIRLRYTFKRREMVDWEVLWTIAHKERGDFERSFSGVRGYGVTHLIHRAFFENDVSIRCTSAPVRLKTHGLAFCQHDNETRQVMLLATNHWFYEGENYVKERPGHSLIFIGKGTNADVPVDSADTGFIFLVTRPGPEARPRGTLDLSLAMKKLRIEAEVKTGGDAGQLRDEARGDDGRGIERLRPALFVVENNVTFRDVVIEGLLHPEFEKQRVQELWDLISILDE